MIMPLTMSINLTQIKLRDLFDGYVNSDENGVIGYHGRLDIDRNISVSSFMEKKNRLLLLKLFSRVFLLIQCTGLLLVMKMAGHNYRDNAP